MASPRGIGKGARSARGEIVDFDLLRIKEDLGSKAKDVAVQAREDFIDNKFKRRLRRMTEAAAPAPVPTVAVADPVSEPTVVEEPAVVPVKKRIVKPTAE